jgi:hypothetical protein
VLLNAVAESQLVSASVLVKHGDCLAHSAYLVTASETKDNKTHYITNAL